MVSRFSSRKISFHMASVWLHGIKMQMLEFAYTLLLLICSLLTFVYVGPLGFDLCKKVLVCLWLCGLDVQNGDRFKLSCVFSFSHDCYHSFQHLTNTGHWPSLYSKTVSDVVNTYWTKLSIITLRMSITLYLNCPNLSLTSHRNI